MGWQEIVALVIVATAAILLIRSEILSRQNGKSVSCGNCSCTGAETLKSTFDV